MIQFVCHSCSAIKQPHEVWVVGLAAESVGATSARREVTIQSAWDRATAVHTLAVHFCSIECKDNYMARLFAPGVTAEEVVVERALQSLPSRATMDRAGLEPAHARRDALGIKVAPGTCMPVTTPLVTCCGVPSVRHHAQRVVITAKPQPGNRPLAETALI
jgi:hypothetical protein